SFVKLLTGGVWFLFGTAYVLLIVVVLAVMGAAAGEIFHDLSGAPRLVGSLLMIAAVALVLFPGNAGIERFLALSVGYLYLVYVTLVVWSMLSFGERIPAAIAAEPIGRRWCMGRGTYAGYNVAIIPAVLFSVRHLTRRREAV